MVKLLMIMLWFYVEHKSLNHRKMRKMANKKFFLNFSEMKSVDGVKKLLHFQICNEYFCECILTSERDSKCVCCGIH